MGAINYYCVGDIMASSDGTTAGYYSCIKEWVESIYDSMLAKWFTIEYDDSSYKITLTPVDTIEATNPLYFTVETHYSDNYWVIYYDNNDDDSQALYIEDDIATFYITLYSDEYFIIGRSYYDAENDFSYYWYFYALCREQTFDGSIVIDCVTARADDDYTESLDFFNADSIFASYNASNYTLSYSGYSKGYVLTPYIIPSSDRVMMDMYVLDGGMDSEVPLGMMVIGGNSYVTVTSGSGSTPQTYYMPKSNILFKL